MKKPDSPQLEALEALLAEKRKHEGYLAKLEERRAGTPEHVFARLRDEYMVKLMDAQVRAHAEAEALESGLDVDQAAVAEVEARLAALEEERVEGELREAVGELDSKEWQKRLIALNAGISMATKERESLTSSATRIRALVAEARGEPAMQQPAAPISEPASAKPAPRTSTAAPIAHAPNFDELAFLNSVVGRASAPVMPIPVPPESPARPTPPESVWAQPSARMTPPPLPPVVPPVAPIKEAPSAKEPMSAPEPESSSAPQLALGSMTTSSAPEPVSAPVPVAPVVPIALPEPMLSAPAPAAPEPVFPPEFEPPSALGRPTPRTSQAIKTLKCSECGSMNYPTEWYCERCGGELAAL